MPLPSASAPRTSWKYCGSAKNMPNIANDTSVARIVPQRKPAERNSCRSASGWPPRLAIRRSTRGSKASTTTPAAMSATAVASDQPSWPALMKP